MDRRSFIRSTLGGALLAAGALPLVGCQGAVPRALAEPNPAPQATDFPVEGKILYVKKGDVWRWSNNRTEQVTRGNRYEGPAWSPDGTRIAASFMGENHSDVVILSEAGAQVRQATHNLSNVSIKDQAWGRKPVWSPDGSLIAYVSDQGAVVGGMKTLDMSLFVVDAEGGTPRKLVVQKPFTGGVDWPSWSPDGVRIAYTAFDSGPSQIQVFNTDTEEWRNLTEQAEGAYDPAWSPDGRWIAYTVREKGKNDVYVMRSDGSSPTRLTDGGASRAPAWSPDGQLLAYAANVGDSFEIMVTKLTIGETVSASTSRQLTKGEGVEAPSGLSWAK